MARGGNGGGPAKGVNKVLGNWKDNLLIGTDGVDAISGRGGNDTLIGLAGDDTLEGGIGDDTLRGGAGALPEALLAQLADRGVAVRSNTPVRALDATDEGWRLTLADDEVLDVACGTGFAALTAMPIVGDAGRVVGTDINPAMIAMARTVSGAAGITWMEASALDLPFDDDTFDAAISIEVIEHVEDQFKFVREMARVTKPNGIVIVTTPNTLNMNSRVRTLLWGFPALYDPLPLEDQDIHVGGHETTVGVLRGAHDRLTPDIETGVDDHAAAGLFLERRDEAMVPGAAFRVYGLHPGRVIHMGDGRNLGTDLLQFVQPFHPTSALGRGSPVFPHRRHQKHIRAVFVVPHLEILLHPVPEHRRSERPE